MAKINYVTDRNLFDDFDNDLITCILYQEDTDFKSDRVLVKEGFAKALYQRYPKMHERLSRCFDAYSGQPKSIINNEMLGKELDIRFDTNLEHTKHKYIFALFTQEHKGEPSPLDNLFARNRRLVRILKDMNAAIDLKKHSVGMPLIGSGNAADPDIKRIHDYNKLSYFKDIVAPIIESSLGDFTVNVYC